MEQDRRPAVGCWDVLESGSVVDSPSLSCIHLESCQVCTSTCIVALRSARAVYDGTLISFSITRDRALVVAQGGSGLGGSGGDGFSFGGYGGIVGHTELRLRSRAWIEDSVKISTSLDSRTVDDRAVVAVNGAGGDAPGNSNDGTWTAFVELTVLGMPPIPPLEVLRCDQVTV